MKVVRVYLTAMGEKIGPNGQWKTEEEHLSQTKGGAPGSVNLLSAWDEISAVRDQESLRADRRCVRVVASLTLETIEINNDVHLGNLATKDWT